jgi:ankyrin repeat protein
MLFHKLGKQMGYGYGDDGEFSWEVILNSPETKVGSAIRSLAIGPGAADDGWSYRSFIRKAVEVGAYSLIKLLISHGADVDNTDSGWPTYLQVAVEHGHMAIAKLLLASGAQVDLVSGGSSALLEAVRIRNLQMVELLIAHGADVNPPQSQDFSRHHSESALDLAIENSDAQMVKALLSAGVTDAVGSQNRPQALISACKSLDTEILELLLASDFNPNPPGTQHSSFKELECDESSALHMACAKGNDRAVRLLIEHGANVNLSVSFERKSGHSSSLYTSSAGLPLRTAAEHGQMSCLRLLFQHGADYALDRDQRSWVCM